MKLSVSIVTYNSEKDIRGVLDSLSASDCRSDCTVTVVDNGSTDRTLEIITSEYPDVTVIHSANRGYGAGNNLALRKAESDVHVVLNPDVLFDETLLSDVAMYMEQNSACVLCTPSVYNMEGELIYSPKKTPRIRYILARFLPWKKGILKRWNDTFTDYNNHSKDPYPIELCAGCFMAMRTKAAQDANGFDERFFLYYEDTDLSRRLLDYGQVMCLPQLRIIHNEKRAAYHSAFARRQMIRSLIRYFNKWGWKF